MMSYVWQDIYAGIWNAGSWGKNWQSWEMRGSGRWEMRPRRPCPPSKVGDGRWGVRKCGRWEMRPLLSLPSLMYDEMQKSKMMNGCVFAQMRMEIQINKEMCHCHCQYARNEKLNQLNITINSKFLSVSINQRKYNRNIQPISQISTLSTSFAKDEVIVLCKYCSRNRIEWNFFARSLKAF